MKKVKTQLKKIEYGVGLSLIVIWLVFVVIIYASKNNFKQIDSVEATPSDVKYDVQINYDLNCVYVNGWCFLPDSSISSVDISLILWDEDMEEGFIVPCKRVERTDVTETYDDGKNYDNSGFSAIIERTKLESDEYQVYIQYRNNDDDIIVDTESVIGR